MRLESTQSLTSTQVNEVLDLVAAATRLDKVAPLSEQVLLSVRDGKPGGSPGCVTGSLHLLGYAGPHLTGYAHLHHAAGDESATAEIVVDPSARRRGVGTALIQTLEGALTPPPTTLQLWSHGDVDGARAFAHLRGYSKTRELWQMRRSLGPEAGALPAVTVPEGFQARHFVVGQDEEDWLRVNALAFVDHPEQGRMTRSDLDRRIAQDWFDASGFILIEDTRGPVPKLIATHWTKVVANGDLGSRVEGEVYVVGVDPVYQGQGFGQIVTVLGLAYLRDSGLTEAMLYVDADNQAAVMTYTRLDFARSAVDIMYSRIVQPV